MDAMQVAQALTRRMDNVKRGLLSLDKEKKYNVKDFEMLIERAYDCAPDEWGTIRARLCRMFEDSQVQNVRKDGDVAYYETLLSESKIQSVEEMSEYVYEKMYKILMENPFPLPHEYLDRVVKGNVGCAKDTDSLRLRILKKWVAEMDCLKAAGYKDTGLVEYLETKTGDKSTELQASVDEIKEDVFDLLTIGRKEERVLRDATLAFKTPIREKAKVLKTRLKEIKGASAKAKKAKEPIETSEEIIGILQKAQSAILALNQAKTDKKVYVNNQEMAVAREESVQKEAMIRLDDVLTALTGVNTASESVIKSIEDIISFLDESLKIADSAVEKLEDQHKQWYKKDGKYGLIKAADDLGSGKFGNATVVREEIYLFALTFGLRFNIFKDMKLDPKMDFEKVMFRDYYTNNMMRYISESYLQLHKGGEDQNPIGSGINFKNYLEVIFLYHMCDGTKRSPLEKLKAVYNMAENVCKQFKEQGKKTLVSSDEKGTKWYIDQIRVPESSEEESVLTEEDDQSFTLYVAENYDCSKDPKSKGVFDLQAEQNTAMKVYSEMLDRSGYGIELDKEEKKELLDQISDLKREEKPIILDEVDGLKCFENHIEGIRPTIEKLNKGEIKIDDLDGRSKFDVLLFEIDRDLRNLKTKAEVSKQKRVSRGDFLKVAYQEYLIEECDTGIYRSLEEVYEEFTGRCNSSLESAYLMKADDRNLYDLILTYSAYCGLNYSEF